MVLSLYGLLKSALLIVNAIAILNEDRLLRKCKFKFILIAPIFIANSTPTKLTTIFFPLPADGWARNQISNFPGAPDDGFKMRALNLIYSVQTVMKIPLIIINILVIAAELVFLIKMKMTFVY